MTGSRTIGRRSALGLIGAAAVTAGAAAGAAPAPRRVALDFNDPGDRLKAYMLMRGALDDRLVIGCVSGQYFGVVDDLLTPLFGVVSATFARYRPRPGGGYDAVTAESSYFTHPESGKALGEMRNPYTGEMVSPPGGNYPPAKISILPDLTLKIGAPMPGMSLQHEVGRIESRGDDVWISELTRTAVTVPGRAKLLGYSERTTLHARRNELEAPGAKRTPCETAFTNVVSWRPWLKMGDRPGHLMAIGAGSYGATLDTLPPAWIDATRERRPELLSNPAGLIDPLWNAK